LGKVRFDWNARTYTWWRYSKGVDGAPSSVKISMKTDSMCAGASGDSAVSSEASDSRCMRGGWGETEAPKIDSISRESHLARASGEGSVCGGCGCGCGCGCGSASGLCSVGCGWCGGSCGCSRSGCCSGWGWPEGGEPREANFAKRLALICGLAVRGE
jgi:hypothetical protein